MPRFRNIRFLLFSGSLLFFSSGFGSVQTGFVNIRTDLMRIPGKARKIEPEKAVKHSEATLVVSIFLNVLSGTRAEVKLRNGFESREAGLVYSVTPEIHIPDKTVRIDFTSLYLMPPEGVFSAPGDEGFNNAVSMSTRRILRVLRPSATGLFHMPGERALVPLFTVYSQYPVSGIQNKIKEIECRLLTVDSDAIQKHSDNSMVEPLLRDYVLDKIAAYPGAFACRLPVQEKKALYQKLESFRDEAGGKTVPIGISIRFTELASPVYRLEFTETRMIGTRKSSDPEVKQPIPVFETFSYEAYLSLPAGKWVMPVRIRSFHAGLRSFFETDNSKNPKEKILLIKANKSP